MPHYSNLTCIVRYSARFFWSRLRRCVLEVNMKIDDGDLQEQTLMIVESYPGSEIFGLVLASFPNVHLADLGARFQSSRCSLRLATDL